MSCGSYCNGCGNCLKDCNRCPTKSCQAISIHQQNAKRINKQVRMSGSLQIYKKQAELGQPILDKINNVIKQIGETEGYDFVFERTTMIYELDAADFTEKVTAAANKSLKK